MFCKHCGIRIPDGAGFCTGCGAKIETRPTAPGLAPPVSRGEPKNKRRKKGMGALMLLVSILLILVGIGHMALAVAGRTATAQVTGYEQRLFINNDDSTRNPRRYQLDYEFAANGKRYTGSVTRVFEGGSQMRQTISIRYLPFWPHVNAEDSGGVNPTGPVVIGVGILLLVLKLKKIPGSETLNAG
jgi:hypothetical protein